ncbi:phosphatidate cytidylyltransferase [Polaribacter sp.]|jgi:phosphatidate cytidylyltransferase|nr:phosphatidate cytidylyltransferase [Polaribacter sp.]MDA9976558.1 phosphatidate cytidylyltransferase [Polaribacter sp.]MDB4167582.1 phosphatidate cytidylyltransferase [Polaribacter sp.]MDB9886937.1 phosphatidate cytidylyltransferase [Polaribacter sp.]MDC1354196.1 phosphatidate cytidylyltransferase [Polaribacter sp.]
MRNLLRRSLSGLIFVFLFVSAILYSKESFVILTTIFAGISIWEFHKIIHFKSLASYLFFAAAVFLLLKNSDNYAVVGILGINIISSLFLSYQLISKKEISYQDDRSKMGLTIRYIVFSFCFLILIPFQGDQYNAAIILSILILIWTNDSFAFLVGKNFGKRKLFVSISPKKTVEGFIGGLVFSIATGYLISIYVTNYSLIDWIVIAVIVSIIGTIGDLIESKFKRQANIKDSGTIMPGHGGILDRFDSLLFVAPFVYLYINFII